MSGREVGSIIFLFTKWLLTQHFYQKIHTAREKNNVSRSNNANREKMSSKVFITISQMTVTKWGWNYYPPYALSVIHHHKNLTKYAKVIPFFS